MGVADPYRKLMQSANSIPDVHELIDNVRNQTAQRILDALFPEQAPPRARAAVRAWFWFMDGVCLDWLDHRDLTRTEVRDLLLDTLLGALTAAGQTPGALFTDPTA